MSEVPVVEAAVIARSLRSRPTRALADATVCSADFTTMVCAALFDAIMALHRDGRPVTELTVAERARCSTSTVARLGSTDTSGATSEEWIAELRNASMRRHVRHIAQEIVARVDRTDTSAEWLNEQFAAGAMLLPSAAANREVPDIETLIEQTDRRFDWLVPYMLERGERLLLVGEEGRGKSVLLRQWSFQIAAGCHWGSGNIIDPHSVLFVDAENTRKQVARSSTWPLEMARKYASGCPHGWDATRLRYETMTQLDIVNNRMQRDTITAWLERYRPELLAIGPLYKVSRNTKRRYEDDAMAMTDILDEWRDRFGCAVMMEHHAPKASDATGARELNPFGSGVWMRWPDVGIAVRFTPQRDEIANNGAHSYCRVESSHFHIEPFRGARGVHRYPDLLVYGDRRFDQWQWHALTEHWHDPHPEAF